MKKSELSFADGFLGMPASEKKAPYMMAFDWDKAAEIIKTRLELHPDLIAEAGLQKDWSCTGGTIFECGKPTNEEYTYLCSNWAIPTLVLSWDGCEQEEHECFIKANERFDSDSKWDAESLAILGIDLPAQQ